MDGPAAIAGAATTLETELQRIRALIKGRACQAALAAAQKLATEAPGNREIGRAHV